MTATAANLPAERKPQMLAGGPVAALVPQTLEEAFRVATAIAQSGLAPQGIQRADQIMVAIMAGAELGLAPFQALQSFAVINGRPTLYGDGLIAVARAQGVQVKEWMEGDGDETVAWCQVTRPDSAEKIKRAFSTADAKKAGLWGKAGPWTQYPKRMLQMRARAWALRDGCADMLRGFQVREEVEDYENVREVRAPETTGMRARLEAREAGTRDQQGFDAEHVAAETGSAIDAQFTEQTQPEPGAGDEDRQPDAAGEPATSSQEPAGANNPAGEAPKVTLRQRADAFKTRVTDAPNTTKLKSINAAAAELRRDLDNHDPDLLAEVDQHFNDRFAVLDDAEKEALARGDN